MRRHGHRIVELERGSNSYKIWKSIKIKRVRVPDLLCLSCALRIESRAKTDFELSMSHSVTEEARAWDCGLEDGDLVAIVVCSKAGDRPIDWVAQDFVQYIHVSDMRAAVAGANVKVERPKGAEEGFEQRLTWPCVVASCDGIITQVTDERIQFKRFGDERTISLKLKTSGIVRSPIVRVGDTVRMNQVLASVVPISTSLDCQADKDAQHFSSLLDSHSIPKRYAGAKALAILGDDRFTARLRERVLDADEHIYVRLEAAAGLAKAGDERGWNFIRDQLAGENLQHRLESIIMLSELRSPEALDLLGSALTDVAQHDEIRAGAAWALGELRDPGSFTRLIEVFATLSPEIRFEAARALLKIGSLNFPELLERFHTSNAVSAPGLAWALSRTTQTRLEHLLPSREDPERIYWIAFIAGLQGREKFHADLERIRASDPQIYFGTTLLWKVMSSWVFGLEEY
ncbi:hypothetical protein HZA57_09975 [Candidatus Poribacteria bacterium]|nr:hypothetical protein [Candidatus Poribacteria bacterium]